MELWEQILSIVISDGVFAVLFVWLFFYQIRNSEKRERNYQKMIKDLSEHLKIITEVKTEVESLKGIIERKKQKNEKFDEKPA